MLVREAMNKGVKTISPNISVKDAAVIMVQNDIGGLIVVDNEKLVGIVTDRDILVKVVAKAKDVTKVTIGEIMTKEVIVIEPDLEIEKAAEVMVENKIKKLPVIENKTLIGILTSTDIITAEPKIVEQIEGFVLLTKNKKPVAG
jgi:CBS domain-containing protein